MERQDVGALEVGGDGDVAQESVGAERGRQVGAENRDRCPTVVLPILGYVNRGRPIRAEPTLDSVAIRQDGGQALQRLSQRDRLTTEGPSN
jgi:hypothetical protein